MGDGKSSQVLSFQKSLNKKESGLLSPLQLRVFWSLKDFITQFFKMNLLFSLTATILQKRPLKDQNFFPLVMWQMKSVICLFKSACIVTPSENFFQSDEHFNYKMRSMWLQEHMEYRYPAWNAQTFPEFKSE